MNCDMPKHASIRRARRWPWVLGFTLLLMVTVPLGYYYLLLDWQGRPFCHKQITLSFKLWMDDNGGNLNSGTNIFPNVGGTGKASLEAIREEMGGSMEWAKNYRYIAGLREDDPGHLVLMYLDQPTRWTWHGPPPTIFKDKKWIVVRVDFESVFGPGECSERISTEDFKKRLGETMDFVRTNARPNWQTVVLEHSKFLETLEQR
jgi:hypothetical protein